jgi:hypothetical protein
MLCLHFKKDMLKEIVLFALWHRQQLVSDGSSSLMAFVDGDLFE